MIKYHFDESLAINHRNAMFIRRGSKDNQNRNARITDSFQALPSRETASITTGEIRTPITLRQYLQGAGTIIH